MSAGFRETVASIGRQIDLLESTALPGERERARALVHELLEAHRSALVRLLGLLPDSKDQHNNVIDLLSQDTEVSALLMLHGLHPKNLETRVEQALSALIPRLAAQNATLTLVSTNAEGRIHLKLEHAGKRGALNAQIEEAIFSAAADAADLHIEEIISVPVNITRIEHRISG